MTKVSLSHHIQGFSFNIVSKSQVDHDADANYRQFGSAARLQLKSRYVLIIIIIILNTISIFDSYYL